MSALPSARTDMPMMPMPVYPHNPGFMHAADNPHMNKSGVQAPGRALHTAHMPTAVATPQEPLQLINSEASAKTTSEQQGGGSDTTAEPVDPSRLKFWNAEETVELIQLYKKYLPEFHKFGQRKMNVWQRVTEEMISKGYGNFSWAECSAKFRSLRDSYRRTTTGGRAHTWQYYPMMKEVMKMEKMILEQEPAARSQKGTITCENEIRPPNSTFANVTATNAGLVTTGGVPNTPLANTILPTNQHAVASHNEGEAEVGDSDIDDINRKRMLSDGKGPSAKKCKDSEQDGEIVVGRNFNGEPVKVKTKKALGPMGALSTLQSLGKSLVLPQSQLVVTDDGQIVQTTSVPTGLCVNEGGQLCNNQSGTSRQGLSMPQWFKMYEKRTRAENSRRLEELKDMHRESLELQRQTLEVARQKNDLLKNLMESLAEFKSLLQR